MFQTDGCSFEVEIKMEVVAFRVEMLATNNLFETSYFDSIKLILVKCMSIMHNGIKNMQYIS